MRGSDRIEGVFTRMVRRVDKAREFTLSPHR